MSTIRDRARGVLLGLAAGDRNGGPIRMAIHVTESLTEQGRFNPRDILDRYCMWWREGAIDTGPTVATVLGLIEDGLNPVRAVERAHQQACGLSAGCNPAHRSAPLAMAAFLHDQELPRWATEEARLTHHDPLAGDVAAAVVVLCRALIRGEGWDTALFAAGSGRLEPTIRALNPANPALLSRGGFAPEVLRAAVHFVGQHTSFTGALTASLSFAGPANYCPVLVGAIGGARWGADAIPSRMLDQCEVRMRATAAADQLTGGWEQVP